MGMAIGASEAEAFWTEFLRSLARRGLRGVRLLISDDHKGLTRILGAICWPMPAARAGASSAQEDAAARRPSGVRSRPAGPRCPSCRFASTLAA